MRFHIVDIQGDSLKVRSFQSQAAFDNALASSPEEGYLRTAVRSETDLEGIAAA